MESLPVTLVIPAFNRADLIGETIASALDQTIRFTEIIVVDDGSTDGTPDVLARFGNAITTIRTANGGVQHARNTGVLASRTPLVALCDSDDLLLPEFDELCGAWMSEADDVDITYTNFVTFSGTHESPDKFSLAGPDFFAGSLNSGWFTKNIPDLYAKSIRFQPLFSSGVVFRRAFYDRLGGYDASFNGVGAEDWEFTLRAIASGNVSVCRKVLTRIRRHAGNDSASALHMSMGEAQVLEHSLDHHPGIEHLRQLILESVDGRRKHAFDAAFAIGDLPLAASILVQIRRKPSDMKSLLKRAIIGSPWPVARTLWRMTQ